MPVGASAGETLRRLESNTELAFVVGPTPAAGWRPWAYDGLGPWEPGDHYYETPHPVMRYTCAHALPNGRRVEIQPAGSWFMGVAGYSADDATAAWRLLEHQLPRRFPGAILWNTPANTGRDLWLRKIDRAGGWPVLPDSLRELIVEHGSGQGRVELIDHPGDTIDGLCEYDGRFMYAALAWELPGGIPTWERGDEHTYEPHARGRYQIRAQVPAGWPHPFGLLGVKPERENWRYPHTPGEQFVTWCDASELHLAYTHGWDCQILEALTWPTYTGKGPLDSWANALVATRTELAGDSRPRELARAALRSLVLHTLGSLHSSSHRVTRYAATADELPAAARRTARPEPDGGFTYPVAMPAKWKQMQHPELAAAVWGRARTRLLAGPGRTGALHAAGEVIAFRTDAIYTSTPQAWSDDGRPGRFRLKRHGTGPYPRPRSGRELLDLRATL